MHRVLRLSSVSLFAQILSGEQISELAANLSKVCMLKEYIFLLDLCLRQLRTGCLCAWASNLCSGRTSGQGYADRKRIGARDHSSRY
jgi:hypothetical protein